MHLGRRMEQAWHTRKATVCTLRRRTEPSPERLSADLALCGGLVGLLRVAACVLRLLTRKRKITPFGKSLRTARALAPCLRPGNWLATRVAVPGCQMENILYSSLLRAI